MIAKQASAVEDMILAKFVTLKSLLGAIIGVLKSSTLGCMGIKSAFKPETA